MSTGRISLDYRLSFGNGTARAHLLSKGPVDDLSISVYDRSADSGIEISCDVNQKLYRPGFESDVLRRYVRVIDWLVAASPGDRVGRAGLLEESERRQIFGPWNDTAAEVPAVGGVGELIAARAAASPDSVAVACGGEWLSYRELEERAGRLVGYFRDAGVGPESVVGLCLPAGASLVIAVLAVWKAGAAYLAGNSANIVRALKWARDNGLRTIAITGFDGGAARVRQSQMTEDLIIESTF